MKKSIITLSCTLSAAIMLWMGLVFSQPSKAEYSQADLNASYGSDAVWVDLSTVQTPYTITQAGDYVLSGSLNGQLLVKAADTDKVHLILNNAAIANDNGPAIYGVSADKIILTLAEGTQNSVSDGVNYALDEEGANAAIYTKTDLTINGTGTLAVTGNTAHGIVSKDDLVVAEGTVNIVAAKDGLRGKDSISIRTGELTIQAGSDGIVSTNTEENLGNILIEAGSFSIQAANDGIQAEGSLIIKDGLFQLTSGSGAGAVTTTADAASSATVRARGRQAGGWNEPIATAADSESHKALKAVVSVQISGGSFTINAQDDAIHSNGDILIGSGNFTIATGDDGMHADQLVHIQSGTVLITQSYEGIEGMAIIIDDGVIDITASDDGINAANGMFTTTGPGPGDQSPQEGVSVTINGGKITAVGGNDGIDSNGTLTVNGGEVNLTSLRSNGGNIALDINGTYAHNGGSVITNDGSETRTGQMGGPGNQPGRRRQ